jgi:hypothetical protein
MGRAPFFGFESKTGVNIEFFLKTSFHHREHREKINCTFSPARALPSNIILGFETTSTSFNMNVLFFCVFLCVLCALCGEIVF